MVSEHVNLTHTVLCLEMSPPLKIHLCTIQLLRTIIVTHSTSQVTTQNILKIIAEGVLIRAGGWENFSKIN